MSNELDAGSEEKGVQRITSGVLDGAMNGWIVKWNTEDQVWWVERIRGS